jgi:hypothetical protein
LCTGLTAVTVHWQTPLSVNRNVFQGLDLSTIPLNVPDGTAKVYDETLVWTEFGKFGLGTKDNFTIKNLKFYPNPAQSQITFTQDINNLEVFDIAGKNVKSFKNRSATFDVSNLARGVYVLNVKTVDGNRIYEKMIKE